MDPNALTSSSNSSPDNSYNPILFLMNFMLVEQRILNKTLLQEDLKTPYNILILLKRTAKKPQIKERGTIISLVPMRSID